MLMFSANEPVNEPVKMVLQIITENPYLSKEKIAQKIGMSRATVTRALSKMVDSGIIKRMGPPKGGYWKIIN